MRANATVVMAAFCALWQPALAKPTIQTVDVPGEADTQLEAINDADVIAGIVDGTSGHGLIRAVDGTFTIFDPPGADETGVSGINAVGDTVGVFSYNNNFNSACFIRSTAGIYTIFGPMTGHRPLGDRSGINDEGDSAGLATRSRYLHAFLRNASGVTSKFLKKQNR